MIDTFYTITLLELFIGGGGRMTAAGAVSLRMVLFAVCLCITLVATLMRTRKTDGQPLAIGLVLAYLLIHLSGLVVGSVNGASQDDMLTEMQQSGYWLAAPFFAMVLVSRSRVRRTANLVIFAGVALALIYLAIVMSFFARMVPDALIERLVDSGEISFRGESFFFYKGFLYLCISVEFLIAIRPRLWVLCTLLVSAALILTLTRGFIISTAFAVLVMLFCQGRWRVGVVALLLTSFAAFVVFVFLPSAARSVASSQGLSTSQRLEDWTYMIHNASVWTFVFGEGFGSLINDRYNIENTFLWVIWKLGIVGLIFWLLPLFLCAHYYLMAPDRRNNRLANAFFFGVVLVYVQTLTNPFLNNPIGLSFVIIALFSLRTLSRPQLRRVANAPALHAGGGMEPAT